MPTLIIPDTCPVSATKKRNDTHLSPQTKIFFIRQRNHVPSGTIFSIGFAFAGLAH